MLKGVHSSKTSARSEPSFAWTSIDVSGPRNRSEPSTYDLNRTPSSSIDSTRPRRLLPEGARPLISSATVPWPIEKT